MNLEAEIVLPPAISSFPQENHRARTLGRPSLDVVLLHLNAAGSGRPAGIHHRIKISRRVGPPSEHESQPTVVGFQPQKRFRLPRDVNPAVAVAVRRGS
jgi:hypothetical protein